MGDYMETDKYYGKIIATGTSKAVIVPKNVVIGNDYKVGDEVIVWIKRR